MSSQAISIHSFDTTNTPTRYCLRIHHCYPTLLILCFRGKHFEGKRAHKYHHLKNVTTIRYAVWSYCKSNIIVKRNHDYKKQSNKPPWAKIKWLVSTKQSMKICHHRTLGIERAILTTTFVTYGQIWYKESVPETATGAFVLGGT